MIRSWSGVLRDGFCRRGAEQRRCPGSWRATPASLYSGTPSFLWEQRRGACVLRAVVLSNPVDRVLPLFFYRSDSVLSNGGDPCFCWSNVVGVVPAFCGLWC
jgi:hypothetical protein